MLRSWSGFMVVGAVLWIIPAGYAGEGESASENTPQLSECETDLLPRLDARVVENLHRKYGDLWSASTIADEEKSYSVWLDSAQETIDEMGLAPDAEKAKMEVAFEQWRELPKLLHHPIYTQILLEELGKEPFSIENLDQLKIFQSRMGKLAADKKSQKVLNNLIFKVIKKFKAEIKILLSTSARDNAKVAQQAAKTGIDPGQAEVLQQAIESGEFILNFLTLHRLGNMPAEKFFRPVSLAAIEQGGQEVNAALLEVVNSDIVQFEDRENSKSPVSRDKLLKLARNEQSVFDAAPIILKIKDVENFKENKIRDFKVFLAFLTFTGIVTTVTIATESNPTLAAFLFTGFVIYSSWYLGTWRGHYIEVAKDHLDEMTLAQLDRMSPYLPAAKVRANFLRSLLAAANYGALPARAAQHASPIDGRVMVMHAIPPGEFRMGEEGQQVHVTLTKPFEMAATEMTQVVYREWVLLAKERFKGRFDDLDPNPSEFKGDLLPVENISWQMVSRSIEALNALSADPDPKVQSWMRERFPGHQRNDVYGLPTEAEWEYVVRNLGRNNETYYFGSDEKKLKSYSWYDKNSGDRTQPVATKQPLLVDGKAFYDLYGNVWEWTQDWYGDLKGGGNPQGPVSGLYRVERGGGWFNGAQGCRSDFRGRATPVYRDSDLGFRLVRTR